MSVVDFWVEFVVVCEHAAKRNLSVNCLYVVVWRVGVVVYFSVVRDVYVVLCLFDAFSS